MGKKKKGNMSKAGVQHTLNLEQTFHPRKVSEKKGEERERMAPEVGKGGLKQVKKYSCAIVLSTGAEEWGEGGQREGKGEMEEIVVTILANRPLGITSI